MTNALFVTFCVLAIGSSAGTRTQSNRAVIEELHRQPSYTKALLALPSLADDVEWWAAGSRDRLPWAGTWRGKAGVQEFFRVLNSEMKYEKFQAEELFADGDRVIAIVSAAGRATRTGRPFESHVVREYQFRDGRIVRVRNFYDTAAYERAFAAAAVRKRDHIHQGRQLMHEPALAHAVLREPFDALVQPSYTRFW